MTMTRKIAVAVMAIAVPLAPAFVQSPQTATSADEDIRVMGKRLETVRISYERTGRRLRSCKITRSSGTPDIDNVMCAFVRSCVANGFATPPRARSCVNARIDGLANSDDAPADTIVAEAAHMPALPAGPDEIIILASRPRDLSGRWTFIETGYYASDKSRSPLPARQWKMCIGKGDTATVLNRILAVRSMIPSLSLPEPPAACRQWRIRAAESEVTGTLQCFLGRSRMTGTLTGHLTGDTVQITKTYKTIGAGFRSNGWADVIGTRIGDCR